MTKVMTEVPKIFKDFDYRKHGPPLKDLGMDGFTTKEQTINYVTNG